MTSIYVSYTGGASSRGEISVSGFDADDAPQALADANEAVRELSWTVDGFVFDDEGIEIDEGHDEGEPLGDSIHGPYADAPPVRVSNSAK